MEPDTKYLEHRRSIGLESCTVSRMTSGRQSTVAGDTSCSAVRNDADRRFRLRLRLLRRLCRLRTRKVSLRRFNLD